MSLKKIYSNYSTMEEINKRLASNEAKKAKMLLETVMSSRQAFQVIRQQVTKDVLFGQNSKFPITEVSSDEDITDV